MTKIAVDRHGREYDEEKAAALVAHWQPWLLRCAQEEAHIGVWKPAALEALEFVDRPEALEDHAENGYRRGYAQGFSKCLQMLDGKTDAPAWKFLAQYHDDKLIPWRATHDCGFALPPPIGKMPP